MDSWSRSFLKTVSWRVVATLTTAILVYSFTGRIDTAVAIGGVEVVAKMFLYFLHERAWNGRGNAAVVPASKEILPAHYSLEERQSNA